jgi:LysR family transcriptional regulator, transcriptional activator of the cysJI operon
MDIKDLRCFIAVFEARSMTRASARLHTVQPNVTIRMRKLEEFLGVRLFERKARGTTPTAMGVRLYAVAQRAVDNFDEVIEIAKSRDDAGFTRDLFS